MNIKRFVAQNTREAIRLVKKEMGTEAVILKTRTIPPSDRAGKRIEVTAAIDYDAPVITESNSAKTQKGWLHLEREIKEIKDAVFSVNASNSLTPEVYFNQELRYRYRNYKTFGLKTEVIKTLMNRNDEAEKNKDKGTSHILKQSLTEVLSKIKVSPNGGKAKGQEIFSFIGPTGVGKTTTLAKLAAAAAIEQGKKSALITLDTFRIAAVAQLQAYARIMGIPIETAVTREDLNTAIHKHNNCDRIFIDTAGRSPNNTQDLAELRNLLDIPADIHPYLVLSATTDYQNLINSEKNFGLLPFKSYIFTKLDETEKASTMINFLISRKKPLSYLCTGQQVPEDIEKATRKKLAALLLTGVKETANNAEEKINGSSCRP